MEKQSRQSKPNKNQSKPIKGNNSVEAKEEKVDSVFVAKQLILADEQKIGKLLFEVRQFKNPNYEKFTERISDNLKSNNFSFSVSVERFLAISRSANEQNTTGHQMTSILKGFQKHWKSCELSYQTMQHLFQHYEQLYSPICKIFANVCREIIERKFVQKYDDFERIALAMVKRFIKGQRKGEEYKALPLVYEFCLYDEMPIVNLVDIIIQEQNTKEIIYIFKDHNEDLRINLIKNFIDRCVYNDNKTDMAKCEKVIRELQLNPHTYPNYIRKLYEKYIGYQVRTYKLYYIELVINHDRRIIETLIDQLAKQGRHRQRKYFIVKYGLQDYYNYNFDPKERYQLSKIKNVLLDCDYFGPTQVEVLEEEQQAGRYIYMKDFGLKQCDTYFLDSRNIREVNFKQELASRKVGIDSQRAGGVHVFDPSDTEIIQIYTGTKVFIFDYQDLKKDPIFKQFFVYIFTYCKIIGQDIQKELTSFEKELQLQIDQKVMQELMRSRLVDVGKLFKKVFPKQTKSNLAYMCAHVFKKQLSKYEQCSGWKNRPLRKAQLHYAALDCVMPYALCEEQEKITKK